MGVNMFILPHSFRVFCPHSLLPITLCLEKKDGTKLLNSWVARIRKEKEDRAWAPIFSSSEHIFNKLIYFYQVSPIGFTTGQQCYQLVTKPSMHNLCYDNNALKQGSIAFLKISLTLQHPIARQFNIIQISSVMDLQQTQKKSIDKICHSFLEL